jgi:hypothetical protein
MLESKKKDENVGNWKLLNDENGGSMKVKSENGGI